MPNSRIMSLAIGRAAAKSAGVTPEKKLSTVDLKRPSSATKKMAVQKSADGESKKTK